MNLGKILLGWMVSISSSCLCGVDLASSSFPCSSAMVTATKRVGLFFLCEISWC